MLPVIQRLRDFLSGSSPEQLEHDEMLDFYQRTLREHPNSATGLPPPINIQVEERQVAVGRLRDDAPEEETPAPPDPVLAPPPPGITSVSPNIVTWEGGTTVTITGENFVSGATVKIAGVAASGVTFIDAAHISCVTPPHSEGYVTVEVINPSGQASSLDNAIYYTVLPDNFLLTGYQVAQGYQLCLVGYPYPYILTARLGSVPFKPSPATPFYVRLLIVEFGNLCSSWINYGQSCFFPGTNNNPLQFLNVTGPSTASLTASFSKADNSPGSLGPNGYVNHGVFLSRTLTGVGERMPLYGDPAFEPNSYRVIIDPTAPPPAGTPPSTEYFVWSDIDRPPGEFPWGWGHGSFHTLEIQCRHATGTLHTGYNGTAGLTVNNLTPPGNGTLTVSCPTSASFVSGVVRINVRADITNPFPGPHFGYFSIVAGDGPIQGNTGTCAVINPI